MKKNDFTQFLRNINLSKKDFAILCNIGYSTVNNWNDEKRPVPPWVESWLQNYIDKKKFESIKKTLKESGVCDEK